MFFYKQNVIVNIVILLMNYDDDFEKRKRHFKLTTLKRPSLDRHLDFSIGSEITSSDDGHYRYSHL